MWCGGTYDSVVVWWCGGMMGWWDGAYRWHAGTVGAGALNKGGGVGGGGSQPPLNFGWGG